MSKVDGRINTEREGERDKEYVLWSHSSSFLGTTQTQSIANSMDALLKNTQKILIAF